ncbi:hypothetical protein BH10PSE6_BH10PSE6_54660 [soil metagenome]
MLSRLYRRAEELDGLCLRAQGYPHDYAIRQELLSALEWDDSFHPKHAHSLIRDLFDEVNDYSTKLSTRLRSDSDDAESPPLRIAEIHSLRQRLANLVQFLKARNTK